MSFKDKLIAKKEEWAREGRGLTGQTWSPSLKLPPGQHTVQGWPVLDLGVHPQVTLEKWTLTMHGLVEAPTVWRWEDFINQPQIVNLSDFHCVTSWSTFDNRWEGVSFKRVIEVVKPRLEARFVLFGSHDGYTTNLPLEVLADDDVLLACKWKGALLPIEHGGPVRLIVPKRYAWKSAKWVKEIVFMKEDSPGFWEVRGYSNTADPWTEDRYG